MILSSRQTQINTIMRLIKSIEERNLLKTPVHIINAKIKKKVLEYAVTLKCDSLLDNAKIMDVLSNNACIEIIVSEVKKEFGIDINLRDFEYCDTFFDFAILIKRKLNTIRMQKTPVQYDFLYVPELPDYYHKWGDNQSEIDKITPFNEIFCKSCLYNIFFSAISHFDIKPFWFISNEIFYYSIENDKLVMKEIENTSNRLLTNYGIEVSVLDTESNIINTIKTSVSNNNPVIAAVDTFYIPSRKDTYLSDHTPHYILIFGYDDKQQLFDIVEHDRFYDLKYEKTKLHYQDFFNSYYSYFKWFGIPRILTISQVNKCPEYTLEEVRNEYINFYIENFEQILHGYDSLDAFLKYFMTSTENETVFWDNIENIISCIDICINRKFSDSYLYGVLFPQSNIFELQLNIQRTWQKLGMILKMIKSRGKVSIDQVSKNYVAINYIKELEIQKTMLINNYNKDKNH